MIELIPAIDMIDGKCVRLSAGDYACKKVYSDDPAEVASRLYDQGFRRLHVVDLDGAKARHCVNLHQLERITSCTQLTVDFGGGIASDTDLQAAFDAGASMVTIGSLAVSQRELVASWLAKHGSERFIIGADVREGRIRTQGWLQDGGVQLMDFIAYWMEAGVSRILCTDISRDGMLNHPNIELYTQIMRRFPTCRLIASGGVSCTQDILDLQSAGIPSVVFGKAYYEGRLDLQKLLSLS